MKFALVIPTDGRKKCLDLLRQSFNFNTAFPENFHLYFIDNKNVHAEEINYLDYLNLWDVASYELIINPERRSIAFNWDKGISWNVTAEWVIVLNDDIEFTRGWDDQLWDKINADDKSTGLYLISKPNSFSGFAINQDFYKMVGPFRPEYKGGGFEDEDFFLMAGKVFNHHTAADLLNLGPVFSFPFSESRGLINHRPIEEYNSKSHWSKENENKEIFERFWKRVKIPTKKTYQGKSGGHYIYIDNEHN